MSIEDDEMLEVFVQESREHLESLEPDLLALEETPEDMEIINRIFRSVHSLKGTSGFFGLDNISNLAHVMENLMSLARDGKLVLSSPMLDALLAGKDKLNIMVEDAQGSSNVDIAAEVEAIKPFISEDDATPAPVNIKPKAKSQPEPEAPANAASTDNGDSAGPEFLKFFQLDPASFTKAYDSNQRIYVLTLHTQKDIIEKKRTPLDFFQEIESLGEFLDSYTDLSPIQSLDNVTDADLTFKFLFSAGMERDLVAGAFDIEPDQIQEVEEPMVKEIAALSEVQEAQPPTEKTPPKKQSKKKAAPPAAPKKAAPPAAPKKAALPAKKSTMGQQIARKKAEETVRVSVSVLDELMTLAGEMVLGRNQLMRLASDAGDDLPGMTGVVQNINVVTTDLQEKVMQTRLQPIGTILGKFNRIIRDLGAKLEKEIDLEITGKDVELDRSILEAISDPLTHLIRNCCDHAIERPEDREAAGKSRRGLVRLIARHAGGQVHVEIIDDGKGVDPDVLRKKVVEKGLISQDEVDKMSDRQAQNIIFLAGFSSAEVVSDVSGRGVGMDVVKTNIENLGGNLELDSTVGKGTRICLKLPLTLAIVPAMIVSTGGHRFAVPQVNLEEVVNLDGNSNKVETVRGTPVLRLRNRLLPLVSLRELLEIPEEKGENEMPTDGYIMVVNTDNNLYGLIVDNLLNIEEIVVKPLSRYMQTCTFYSGATILGDGKVAVILDTTGMADVAKLSFQEQDREEDSRSSMTQAGSMRVAESQSLLIFRSSEQERFAINLAMVARIEKIKSTDIERVGSKEYIKYLGGSLRLLRLHDFMPVGSPEEEPEHLHVIVPNLVSVPMGIVATEVIDAIESSVDLDHETVNGEGILGSAILNDHLTLFVDIYGLFELADPEHYKPPQPINVLADKRILMAEDTSFFRTIVYQYLKDFCHTLDVAKHGQEAWEMLQDENNDYDLLLTDIEMPFMDGFELTERVRASERWANLPVVALTALSSDKHMEKGKSVGVTAYETKLDKERLRKALESVFSGNTPKGLPGPDASAIEAETVS